MFKDLRLWAASRRSLFEILIFDLPAVIVFNSSNCFTISFSLNS